MVRTDGWTGKDLVLCLVTRALLTSRIAFRGIISHRNMGYAYKKGSGRRINTMLLSLSVRIICFH